VKVSGDRVQAVSADGEIVLWDRASGAAVDRHTAGGRWLAIAPDGERMLALRRGELSLYDANTRRFLWHVTRQPEPRLAALSAGSVAVVVTGPTTVAVLRLADGVELVRVNLTGITVGALSLAASGRLAAFWDPARSSDFAVLEVEREKSTILTHESGSQVHAVAISPDGTHLASTGNRTPVVFWDAATLRAGSGRPVQPPPRTTDVLTCAAFSPDGNLLATGNRLGDVQVWDVTAGRRQCEARLHTRQVTALGFATDGSCLVSGSVDCAVRELPLPGEAVPLAPGHTGPIRRLVSSRDGGWLLSQGLDGTTRVWDGATGLERARFGGHSLWNIAHATLSEDGRYAWAGDRRMGPLHDPSSGDSVWAGHRKDVAIGPAVILPAQGGVLVAAARGLMRYRLADGNPLEEKPFPVEVERPLAFVERGSRLLCLDKSRQLRLFDLREGKLSKPLPAPYGGLKALPAADVEDWENFALSTDGTVLVVADPLEGLWLWLLPKDRQISQFSAKYTDGSALAVDTEGTRVAVADPAGDLYLYDKSGDLEAHWPAKERSAAHQGPLGPLAFLPEDRLLAATPTGPILLCSLQPREPVAKA
jgi:WD40 repeat protein